MSDRYCSWCWRVGHNSATCPERKKHINDNPHSFEAEREAKKLERRKNRKQTARKCGFCKKPGHNAKTCHTKKEIHSRYSTLTSAYRRVVLEEMCVMGLGVGALVNLKLKDRDPMLAMVKDIKWDRIYPASDGSNYCVQLERLGPIDEEYYKYWSPERARSLGKRHLNQLLTRPMMGEVYQRDDVYQRHLKAGGPEMEVVSPVNVGLISPPSDWLGGELSERMVENPLKNAKGKDSSMWELNYEMAHFAYFSGVLGLKESEKYFSSFF